MKKDKNEQPETAIKDIQEPVKVAEQTVNKAEKVERILTIRDLANEANTPEEIYEGVKVAKGWKEGKIVSKEEYNAAVKEFSDSPADGRTKKEDKN